MGLTKAKTPRAKTREYAAAEARGRRQRAAGLHATAVFFDESRQRVVLELTSGYSIGIPLARFREISHAPLAQLREAELVGAGTALHWESLDADYSVPALVLAAIGTKDIARHFGRAGGKATSRAKAKAARSNGAKGGRPRVVGRNR
jgi:hypothetical protein